MPVKLTKKGNGASKKDLDFLERQIGRAIPEDYRLFLSDNNGGVPEDNEFDVPGSAGNSGVNEFFSIKEVTGEKTRHSTRFPAEAWPIAFAEGGNYVCLVFGERAGVYFWYHELEADDNQSATWENMFHVAKTFAEFWENLRKFDITKIKLKPGQVIKTWEDPNFKPEF